MSGNSVIHVFPIDQPGDVPVSAPRVRDAARTREAILQAAVHAFAARGYDGAGLRDVAAAAGVNAALVGRYFGSKEQLFEAALAQALDLSVLLKVERSHFGLHVARILFETQDAPSPFSMMILSAANPVVHGICVRLLQQQVIAPLALWIGAPNGPARAAQLNMLWSGFLTASQLLPLEVLKGSALEDTRHWLARASQAIVDDAA